MGRSDAQYNVNCIGGNSVTETVATGLPGPCGPGPLSPKPQPSKFNRAAKSATQVFVGGQVVGTAVGCGVGVLVATGGTIATETYPLEGANAVEGCIGGGLIGFFEALPYSTLGAIVEFGWSYWGD